MKAQRFILDSEENRANALLAVANAPDGYALNIEPPGRSRNQNSLQHKWYAEIADQMGVSPATAKRFCKLRFGVPILRAESDKFREVYDRVIKPLPYEDKEDAMDLIDVTSILNKEQAMKYMDDIEIHFRSQGYYLTHPDDRGREEMLHGNEGR